MCYIDLGVVSYIFKRPANANAVYNMEGLLAKHFFTRDLDFQGDLVGLCGFSNVAFFLINICNKAVNIFMVLCFRGLRHPQVNECI